MIESDIIGIVHAGITASLTCFPLDVARTRILAAPHGSSLGLLALMRSIARSEGVGGLYSGVLPALISVAPSGAVFYGTYDVLKVSCPAAFIIRQSASAAHTWSCRWTIKGMSSAPLVLACKLCR